MQKTEEKFNFLCVFGLVLSSIWLKYGNSNAFGQKIDIWFGKMYLNHLELYSYTSNEKYMFWINIKNPKNFKNLNYFGLH